MELLPRPLVNEPLISKPEFWEITMRKMILAAATLAALAAMPVGANAQSSTVGGALVGAGTGAVIGAFGGPVGAFGGALVGGTLGIAEAYMENLARATAAKQAQQDKDAGITDAQKDKRAEVTNSLAAGAMPPISLSLNLDGRTLAQAMSTAIAVYNGFPLQAPSADGLGQHYSGDHNFPDN